MRGKKVDKEFLSSFIAECCVQNKEIPSEIVKEAKLKISKIDDKIKEVEILKRLRSKLLDVVLILEKPEKINKSEEIRILSYFNIKNLHICKFICGALKNEYIEYCNLKNEFFLEEDLMFCIKQLIEYNILYKKAGFIYKDINFDNYIKFINER